MKLLRRAVIRLVLLLLALGFAPLSAQSEPTPPSAPDAPTDAVNLTLGKTIWASFRPEDAQKELSDGANLGPAWWAGFRQKAWAVVDLGSATQFNYLSVVNKQALPNFGHFSFLYSNEEGPNKKWTKIVEVSGNSARQWNGYIEPITARYVLFYLDPPSFDVHLKLLGIYDLTEPLKNKDGTAVTPLKPLETPAPAPTPAAAAGATPPKTP